MAFRTNSAVIIEELQSEGQYSDDSQPTSNRHKDMASTELININSEYRTPHNSQFSSHSLACYNT